MPSLRHTDANSSRHEENSSFIKEDFDYISRLTILTLPVANG